MTMRLLQQLKNKASQMTYGSRFYDWSLQDQTPDRLIVKPVDPWRGDEIKGQALCDAAGANEKEGPEWYSAWWEPEGMESGWLSHMHSFEWLRDLRAMGGQLAPKQGHLMIKNWIETFSAWSKTAWESDITGQRLSMWVSHYDYFCAGADEHFEDLFFTAFVKQARHLQNSLCTVSELKFLQAVKGLLYGGLALEGREQWIEQALTALEKDMPQQILADGGHASRSPAKLLSALQIYLDIRSALTAGGYPVPDSINELIERMSRAISFFRYADRKFAVFQGSQEGDNTAIDAILAQAGARGKIMQSLPYTGFERATLGRSLLMIDTGKTAHAPYDENSHASPLAFEFCYGKDRLFVSCGAHPTSPEWNDALRSTAGHNTACLDYRNACEIRKDGLFGRKVTEVKLEREDTRDHILISASHNGYVPLNGVTHTRKFYLTDDGNDFRGEDSFSSCIELARPVDIAIRFHLHPSVTASLIKDSSQALLRMPGGTGWRFHFAAGKLSLEESLYIGEGTQPRKTKQLVIYGYMTGQFARVQWSLKRENA